MANVAALPVEGAGSPFWALWASYERHLNAEGKAPRTLEAYRRMARQFMAWLEERHVSSDPVDVQRQHIESWMIDMRERLAPATQHLAYAAMRAFFSWLVAEEELERSPMERLKAPKLNDTPPPMLDEQELAALFKACEGKTFLDRRDAALFRFLLDTGLRRSEALAVKVDDIDLKGQTVQVTRKGNRRGVAYYGAKTARDLDRYLRVRVRHPQASSAFLWLPGSRGGDVLGEDGLRNSLIRRAEMAGIGHVKIHQMRHQFAHYLKRAGVSDQDVMVLGGWRSPQVMARYGAAAAQERARDAHRRMSPGDRL